MCCPFTYSYYLQKCHSVAADLVCLTNVLLIWIINSCLWRPGMVLIFISVTQGLPDPSTRPAFTSISDIPLFFGTAIFAFEGISLVSRKWGCWPFGLASSQRWDWRGGWSGQEVLNFYAHWPVVLHSRVVGSALSEDYTLSLVRQGYSV